RDLVPRAPWAAAGGGGGPSRRRAVAGMPGRLRLSALALVGPGLRGRAAAEPGGAFAEFLRWAEGRGATAAPGLGVGVDPATGLRLGTNGRGAERRSTQ
ncbi:unnamed protein product, partial [Prorocentrum cordatum]